MQGEGPTNVRCNPGKSRIDETLLLTFASNILQEVSKNQQVNFILYFWFDGVYLVVGSAKTNIQGGGTLPLIFLSFPYKSDCRCVYLKLSACRFIFPEKVCPERR